VTLHGRAPPAHQPIGRNLGSAGRPNGVREQGRLIVTTPEKPGPMQRYRNQEVRSCENFAAGTVHPATERPRNMGVIAMLEPENEAAASFVVPKHGARLVPGRLLTGAVPAQCILSNRMREWQAAQHAPRWRKERDPSPTSAAERIRLVDEIAAGKTAGRQHAVDDGPADLP
jgi:hypothetical protein